jgi:hypothetical protein
MSCQIGLSSGVLDCQKHAKNHEKLVGAQLEKKEGILEIFDF